MLIILLNTKVICSLKIKALVKTSDALGLRLSLKNKKCRTPKSNLILELTNFFSDAYSSKKQKTQKLKAFESRLVAGTGLEPVTFGL